MRAPRPYVSEPMDPTEVSPSGEYRAFKAAGLLLLALAWIVPGLVGHDPWKYDEAVVFGDIDTLHARGHTKNLGFEWELKVVFQHCVEPGRFFGLAIRIHHRLLNKLFQPRLVIELDGWNHKFANAKEVDQYKDDVLADAGLPRLSSVGENDY